MNDWLNGAGLGIAVYVAWCALERAAKAVGDWLIRWRLAGHDHCPQCSLEAANKR